MSLVNDSLKFQIAISQINCYFLLKKKCENPLYCNFSTKHNSVFAFEIDSLQIESFNDSIKLKKTFEQLDHDEKNYM